MKIDHEIYAKTFIMSIRPAANDGLEPIPGQYVYTNSTLNSSRHLD